MSAQKIVVAVLLVSMMLCAGFETNREALRRLVSKAGLLLRAIVANFVVVPLVAVLLCRAFRLPDPIATALILMALAPGVPFLVLSGGRQRGGSHEFAVELAMVMPAVSVLTIPIAANFILPASDRLTVPATVLVSLCVYQLAPLILGVLVAQWSPASARKLARPARYVTMGSFVVLLALLVPAMVKGVATVFGTFGLFAMLLTVLISVVVGWIAGGPHVEYRRTLAIGTALRNPGIALMIATTQFKDARIAAGVMAYLLVQIVVSSLAGTLFKRV